MVNEKKVSDKSKARAGTSRRALRRIDSSSEDSIDPAPASTGARAADTGHDGTTSPSDDPRDKPRARTRGQAKSAGASAAALSISGSLAASAARRHATSTRRSVRYKGKVSYAKPPAAMYGIGPGASAARARPPAISRESRSPEEAEEVESIAEESASDADIEYHKSWRALVGRLLGHIKKSMGDQKARQDELERQHKEAVRRAKELKGLLKEWQGHSEQLVSDVARLEAWVKELGEHPSEELDEEEPEDD